MGREVDLQKSIGTLKDSILFLQQLLRLVSSNNFLSAYNHAVDDVKPVVRKKIENGDYFFIFGWYLKNRDLSEYTMRELRSIASELRVKNYGKLDRVSLLVEITSERNRINKRHT